MSLLDKWRNSGKHLPGFMRDFHDQKDLFKYMDEVVEGGMKRHGSACELGDVTFRKAMIYTIDIFLWVMARHGYTLQHSRAKLPFENIEETVRQSKRERDNSAKMILSAAMREKR